MAPYIYMESISELYMIYKKTEQKIDEAYNAINNCVAEGGTVLFVGTKTSSRSCL